MLYIINIIILYLALIFILSYFNYLKILKNKFFYKKIYIFKSLKKIISNI